MLRTIGGDGGRWGSIKDIFSLPSPFSQIIVVGALLLGGMLGYINPVYSAAFAGGLFMLVITILRQDELAVTAIIAVHVYVDWYLGLHIVAPLMSLLLLGFYFLARSAQHPWIKPDVFWLWILFLLLTISPAIQGALMLYDAASYYPSDIVGALLMFWLGILIARNYASVHRCYKLLSGLGTLLALHTIIQATTGVVIFGSSHYDALMLLTSNYQIWHSTAHRAGSFFVDPNWNGTFLGMIFFLPFGLFVESSSLPAKALYFLEMCLILPALLFTYSTGAWIAFFVGLLAFIIFVGRTHYRLLLPIFFLVASGIIMVLFPDQISNQLLHVQDPSEVPLRIGAWLTALRVISAFPWTGVGLGYQNYLERSEPFRVPQEYVALAHPHNSYLEWGAMAGLPVLFVFLALLLFALWQGMRNWMSSGHTFRPLLGGGIVSILVLSINSWTINAWTLPALAMPGWFILGVLASPLLRTHDEHARVSEEQKCAPVVVSNKQ